MLNGKSTVNYENHLRTALLDSSNRFDNAVLTLSSGLLALSLTFMKDIVAPNHAKWLILLVGSWGALGVAVISTVASFITSQKCLRARLERKEPLAKRWITATEHLNVVSAVLFILGVVLTVIFVSVNLNFGATDMHDDEKEKPSPLTEGYVPEQKPLEGDHERGYVPPPPPATADEPAEPEPPKDND